MATEKQIRANRENSKKSTGPISPEGKAIVSQNAIKHGVLSSASLLPDENFDMFQTLQDKMLSYYQPVGGREEALVDRIISYMWRLRRLFQIEAWSLKPDHWLDHTEKNIEKMIANRFISQANQLLVLSRYESSIERMMARAIQELEYVQSKRSTQELPVLSVSKTD